MNKVYKRFFDELDSHEIEYIASIDNQIFEFASTPGDQRQKNLPCMKINLKNIKDHEFFLYLESFKLIFDFKLKELEASFFISSYFMPYYSYYLKNIKIK